MIPKRLIQSLQEKKHRNEKKLFLVEGEKNIAELLLSDFVIESVYVTHAFHANYKKLLDGKKLKYELVEQGELEKYGTLESNNAGVAIVRQKSVSEFPKDPKGVVLALDEIRDPGNLGTIIRIADWYGIRDIIVSKSTTDIYNNKTIQASMGSFTRVNVFYVDLAHIFSQTKLPIYGTYLEGKNVHEVKFPENAIILLGNESNGISKELERYVKEKITIPRYGNAESLNVSIATAIILDNLKRN